jgi:GT2 family glycosyltransferase
MNLYIYTLSWQGSRMLKNLAPTLIQNINYLKNKKGIDSHWYIKDNASKDDTSSYINSINHQMDIVYYQCPHNKDSFSKGNNVLHEMVSPNSDDFILLLNNDVVFGEEDALSKMFDLQEKTNAGVVGSRLMYIGTNKLQHAGVIFSPKYNMFPYHYRFQQESDKDAEKNRYFQAVTGACLLTKASSYNRVNGMNLNYSWNLEDIDYCLSVGQTEKIAYCGKSKIYHEESVSLRKNPVHKLFLSDNLKFYKKKWGHIASDLHLYKDSPNYNEC